MKENQIAALPLGENFDVIYQTQESVSSILNTEKWVGKPDAAELF